MKCILCSRTLKEKLVEYREFGISFGKFKALVCENCNSNFFGSGVAEKVQQKSKKLGLFGLAKKTKVARVGNSLAIRIPKKIANFTKLKKEEIVKIVPKNRNELTIEIIN